MPDRTILAGRFRRLDLAYLAARANNATHQRHIFYKAMLEHDTYEAYLKDVGNVKAFALTFGQGKVPITGRAEILYARRFRRIEDAPG
jgi:hypothetical protein